jgi:hypothetical protein
MELIKAGKEANSTQSIKWGNGFIWMQPSLLSVFLELVKEFSTCTYKTYE